MDVSPPMAIGGWPRGINHVRQLEWFHIILIAYAEWLNGDRLGFRTHHHREHVEGDYKNPLSPLSPWWKLVAHTL